MGNYVSRHEYLIFMANIIELIIDDYMG